MKRIFLSALCLVHLLSACSENGSEEKEKDATLLAVEEFSGLHVAFADYLEETDEYAVHLMLRNTTNWNQWDKHGAPLCGKTIYEEEFEFVRREMSEELAKTWLDVRFLKHLHLYDTNNRDLGEARFVRYEYISRNLSSDFVAIVKMENGTKAGNYAIGGRHITLPTLELDRKPRKELLDGVRNKLQDLDEWGVTQIGIAGHYFSLYQATHPKEYETTSQLLETVEDKTREVLRNDEGEIIIQLQPLPLSFNKKPVLLLAKAIMNSDVFWSAVFVYDGKKYVSTRNWGKLGKSSN